jgi:predicted HTH transcriptional regulator
MQPTLPSQALNSIFKSGIKSDTACYHIPSSTSIVVEQLTPSPLAFIVPFKYIQCCVNIHMEKRKQLQELQETKSKYLSKEVVLSLIERQLVYHDTLEKCYLSLLSELSKCSNSDSSLFFRKSKDKITSHLQAIPLNCFIHSVSTFSGSKLSKLKLHVKSLVLMNSLQPPSFLR